MRHKGSCNELIAARDKDLFRVYREIISNVRRIDIYKVAEEVANHPAKCFYVSEARALNVIRKMMKGENLDKILPLRKEMYEEIYRRVKEMRAKHPNRPLRDIVETILCQPAPRFYLTKSSCLTILYRIFRRKCYATQNQNIRIGI